MKDKNGNEFHMEAICADLDRKEMVKITNGIPHDGGRGFEPTEAMALRVTGVRPRKGRKSVPVICFTYVSVNMDHLTVCEAYPWPDLRDMANFAGRI